MSKIILSGPMTGYENFNRELFNYAAHYYRKQGFEVFNPAELPDGHDYHWYMKRCLEELETCRYLVQLPGWEDSNGACIEYECAVDLGLVVVPWKG